ncbi:MAG: hypothetical protein IJP89_05725 [Synergistaceae bacterium]|nr:hypothetical protein [Synergistaceae bacterium]
MNPAVKLALRAARAIVVPYRRFEFLASLGLYDSLSDEEFIRRMYKSFMGREIDLDNPKTLCEKLNWLKLHDRRPEYTLMADKYAVKSYVAERIGAEHVVPLLGVWDSFDEIDFDALPEQFVLKCTHDSGGVAVCRDKSTFDRKLARKILEKSLARNYSLLYREWAYKNVPRRIIAEQYIPTLGRSDSVEFKITCLNGIAKLNTICRGPAHTFAWKRTNDHYDRDMKRLKFYVAYKNPEPPEKIPPQMHEIMTMSEKLSAGIPYVRVDWYISEGRIYFGEFTFYTWGGFMRFNPPEWDEILGSWLELPAKV